jgi:hypothetical protein
MRFSKSLEQAEKVGFQEQPAIAESTAPFPHSVDSSHIKPVPPVSGKLEHR